MIHTRKALLLFVLAAMVMTVQLPAAASASPAGVHSHVCDAGPIQGPQAPGAGTIIVRVYYSRLQPMHSMAGTPFEFEPFLLETNYEQGYHIMALTQTQIDSLVKAGYRIVRDRSWSLPASTKTGIATIPNYPCYRTVEETYAAARAIVQNYPNLATFIDAGDSWEKKTGRGGYDVMVLKLTNAAIPGPKPKLFVSSSIHAREYVTAELNMRFAEHLINNYGKDPDITWMLDYHEAHLMLYVNPDGRKHAERGEMWRKNTNTAYCGPTSSMRGVDLNRNFAYQWGGASTSQCSETYQGPSPASEPETQNMQNYVKAIFPDQRGPGANDPAPRDAMGVTIDLHSYGEFIMSNSGPNGTDTKILARKWGYLNGYDPGFTFGQVTHEHEEDVGVLGGMTFNYTYGELGVAGYLIELGTAFFQNCSYFTSSILPKNMPVLLYALKVARTPYMTPSGPDALSVTVSSSSVPAGTPVTLNASLDDTRYSGTVTTHNIAAGEYYIDVPPWQPGARAIPMNAADGSFDSKIEGVRATVNTTGLTNGRHIIFVRGRDAGNNWGPVSAVFLTISGGGITPTPITVTPTPITVTPTPPTTTPGGTVFADDFETEKGWVVNPNGSDTATLGRWERGDPEATDYNGPKQLGTTSSGVNDLVTGRLAGSGVGAYDLDGGVSSVRSPSISLPSSGNLTLSLRYYLAHASNASSADYLRVKIVGSSGTSTVFEKLGAATDVDASWQTATVNLSAYAGQTIQIVIEAADADTASLLESAVDDVRIAAQ